jgi:hypothetical protein|tara:strand:- start:2307 stop:3350 length:1044 start_codon:yes stop_codon:yes gene_type:complete
MPLPRTIVKPTLPLVPKKVLSERREQLLEYIKDDGTYLPKSVLHADLDRGMLDFVKTELEVVTAGKIVPLLDIIITTQNWSQYLETWKFVDMDYNPSPPFITVVRNPEVKYGTNPSLQYTIPNRKQFYYASVPTWNGNEQGMDIYTIPQPVPVDIKYSVKIICNRMRELNQLNKVVMQTFASRQAYTFIKGQYVPIIMDNVSDESQMNMESRKYYVQSYEFTMLGYLIDEDEFEVKPAIQRVTQLIEIDTSSRKQKRKQYPENPNEFQMPFLFVSGNTSLTDRIDFTANMTLLSTDNIDSFDVYINNDYYGSDLQVIEISTNDILRIDVTKNDDTQESTVLFENKLV